MIFFDAHTHWISSPRVDGEERLKTWLAAWSRCGVTHGVVMPLQSLSNDLCIPQENDEIAAVCAHSGGRMIPFCTVNPTLGADALAEFRRCLETLHCRGIKIHPWLQGISPSSREVDELCDLAAQLGAVVLLHNGTPCFSLPSQMALLARRHPKTTIILGHCGLFEHWREAISAMRHSENLWGCLCGPHLAALREFVTHSGNRSRPRV